MIITKKKKSKMKVQRNLWRQPKEILMGMGRAI
jgi:hypothetical protein